jgi:phosphoserine phosphatase RsbU/P
MDMAASMTSPTILIIDDTPTNVKVLEIALKKAGYSTLAAFSGPDGEKLAEASQPDLILLDIMMPGKSGFDTCADLKQNPRTQDIPIIFLSAVNDVASKVKGLSIGAVDYITKPFHREEVLARTGLHLKMKTDHRSLLSEQASKLEQIRAAQQSILVTPRDCPGARFSVQFVPVLEAGGDFYDVFESECGVIHYFVADVSGHDLGASFTTAALKALIRQSVRASATPVESLTALNEGLSPILCDGKHLTACYACLDRVESTLTIVSAGHPPAILAPSAGDVRFLEIAGDILGVFDEIVLEPLSIRVAPGDRFFLYSDGLFERFEEGLWGREKPLARLLEICGQTGHLTIGDAVWEIVERMAPAKGSWQDDVVLLGFDV